MPAIASDSRRERRTPGAWLRLRRRRYVDPQAWLADVLARIAELPHARLHELLPWNWKAVRRQTLAAWAGSHLTFRLRTSRTPGIGPHVPRYSPDGYAGRAPSVSVRIPCAGKTRIATS